MKSWALVLLAISGFCQGTSSDSERLFAFRKRSASLLIGMPSYTCLESMAQSVVDTRGRVTNVDLLRLDVAISGTREMYSWSDSPKFSDRSLASALSNGFNTVGIFSTLAKGLATIDSSRVRFVGEESLGDERVFRYAFAVSASAGSWWIRSESIVGPETGQAGEQGLFWVDASDLTLRKIDVSAADIPSRLPLKNLRAIVNYELTTIGSIRVLLPAAAVVKSQIKSQNFSPVSHIVFNHCRAFHAESTVTFEGVSGSGVDPRAKTELPRGVTVPIELSSAINWSSTERSDELEATIPESVRYKGNEIIPKGSRVEGHVFTSSTDRGFVLEINRIDTASGWQRFYGRLLSVGADVAIAPQTAEFLKQSSERAVIALVPTPGVAVLTPRSGSAIPGGTKMVWETEALTPRVSFRQDRGSCEMCFGPPPFK